MKKLLSFALVLVMSLSLVSCGGGAAAGADFAKDMGVTADQAKEIEATFTELNIEVTKIEKMDIAKELETAGYDAATAKQTAALLEMTFGMYSLTAKDGKVYEAMIMTSTGTLVAVVDAETQEAIYGDVDNLMNGAAA